MITKLAIFFDSLLHTPEEIAARQEKKLSDDIDTLMDDQSIEYGLKRLQENLSKIREQGGQDNILDLTLTNLDYLLSLKPTGGQIIRVGGTDISFEFDCYGGLISIKPLGKIRPPLRKPPYKHGRQLKKHLP